MLLPPLCGCSSAGKAGRRHGKSPASQEEGVNRHDGIYMWQRISVEQELLGVPWKEKCLLGSAEVLGSLQCTGQATH